MEPPTQPGALHQIAGTADLLLVDLAQLRDDGLPAIATLGTQPRTDRLEVMDDRADLLQLHCATFQHQSHQKRRTTRPGGMNDRSAETTATNGDQSLAFQNSKALTHRRRAGAELPGEVLLLGQQVAVRQVAVDDALPQHLGHQFRHIRLPKAPQRQDRLGGRSRARHADSLEEGRRDQGRLMVTQV